MLDKEEETVSLGHKSITGNEIADIEAKTYPPQELGKWLTTKAIESRNLKWKKNNNKMKEKTANQNGTKTQKNRIYENHSQL
jgi:hypothetical protein